MLPAHVSPRPFDLQALAENAPDAPAFILPAGPISYAELAQGSAQTLTLLLSLGLDLETPVPVVFSAEPNVSTLVLLSTLLHVGAPCVPLHPRWSASERQAALLGKPAHLVLPEGWVEALPQQPSKIACEAFASPPLKAARGSGHPGAIIFTSGTSGTPRGVCLTQAALCASAQASAENLGWQDNDRWLLNLPLAHIGGLSVLIRCLLAQKPCVLANSEQLRSPSSLVTWIEQSQTTLLSLVPTQLQRWLNTPGLRLPSCVRAILVGGAALSPTLEREALARGWPILPTYGLTEAASQVATRSPAKSSSTHTTWRELHPSEEGTVGKPLAHLELRIATAENATTALELDPMSAASGIVEIRGTSLFSGYWGEPERTQGAWFSTADVGIVDTHGHLKVLGRADDMVISGGENVAPDEVEAALLEFPGVLGACVFGVPDSEWGVALACVVSPDSVSTGLLYTHLANRLSGFKRPKWIALCPELPTGSSGKVKRRDIRARFREKLRPWVLGGVIDAGGWST